MRLRVGKGRGQEAERGGRPGYEEAKLQRFSQAEARGSGQGMRGCVTSGAGKC